MRSLGSLAQFPESTKSGTRGLGMRPFGVRGGEKKLAPDGDSRLHPSGLPRHRPVSFRTPAQNAGLLHADREIALPKLVSQGKCTRNPSRPCILGGTVHRACGMSGICPFGATSPCVLCRGARMRGARSQSPAPALRNERAIATAPRSEHPLCRNRADWAGRMGTSPYGRPTTAT